MDVIENLLTLPATYAFIIYLIILPFSHSTSYRKKLSAELKSTFVGYNLICLIPSFICTCSSGLEIWEHGTMELVKLKKDDIFKLFDITKLLELLDTVFIIFFLNKHKTNLFPICTDIPMFLLADYAFNFAQFKPFCGVIFLNSILQLLMHIYYCISVQGEIIDAIKELLGIFITIFQLIEYVIFFYFLFIGYSNHQYSGYNIVGSFLVLVFNLIYVSLFILTERNNVKRHQ